MATTNGVMTMRPLDKGLSIEPGKTVKLAPGGYHLMLLDLKSPLKQGDKVPVTLEFEKAGKVKLSLDVQGVGAKSPAGAGECGRPQGYEEDARSFRHEDVRLMVEDGPSPAASSCRRAEKRPSSCHPAAICGLLAP